MTEAEILAELDYEAAMEDAEAWDDLTWRICGRDFEEEEVEITPEEENDESDG